MARCLIAAGRGVEAILLLQRILARRPDDGDARALVLAVLAEVNAGSLAHEMSLAEGGAWGTWWRRALESTRHATRIGFAIGHDSNINSATAIDVVTIPALNYRSVALNPLLVRRASTFAGINAALALKIPLSDSVNVVARGAVTARYNAAQYEYFPHNYALASAIEKRFGGLSLELAADYVQRRVAGFRVVDRMNYEATLGLTPAPTLRLSATLASARNTYPLFAGIRTDEHSAGLRVAHTASGLALSLHVGRERSIGAIKDLDRDYTALSLDWNRAIGSAGRVYLHLGESRSDYLAFSPLFLAQRVDKVRQFVLAYEHRIGANWALTPRLAMEHNASTIPIIAFRRTQWMLELSKDF